MLSPAHELPITVKWLGKDAITALAIDGKGSKADMLERVARWVAAGGRNVSQPVMIVSYETLRTLSVHLANCTVGLLLCDEGHRLKNSGNPTLFVSIAHTDNEQSHKHSKL